MKIDGTFQGGCGPQSGSTTDIGFTTDLGIGPYTSSVGGCTGTYGMGGWQPTPDKLSMVKIDTMQTNAKSFDIPVYWQATGFIKGE